MKTTCIPAYRYTGVHTGAVSFVAVVGHTAVLVAVTDKLLDDTSAVVALEVAGVLAVRRCKNAHNTNTTSLVVRR